MRRLLIILVIFTFAFQKTQAQKEKAVDAAVGIGIGLATVFATAAAMDAFIEGLENNATEWVLREHPEWKEFKLSLLNLRGEKLTNMSDVSSCTFLITLPKGQKYVLMWVVSQGWWNEYGVDFSRIHIELFNSARWQKILFGYIKAAARLDISDTSDIPIYVQVAGQKMAETFYNGKLANNPKLATCGYPSVMPYTGQMGYKSLIGLAQLRHLRTVNPKGCTFINFANNTEDGLLRLEFEKIDGDSYLVYDVDNIRVIYNEKSLNLYFKEIGQMVKIRNAVFQDINSVLGLTFGE